MGFSRQEYWAGLPFPFPEDFPNLEIKPGSLALQADSLLSEPPGTILSNWPKKKKKIQEFFLPDKNKHQMNWKRDA